MARQTFKQIYDLSLELRGHGIDSLNHRISAILASAELNAHDTIYVEKAAAEDQFDAIALASLESNLCFCEDHDVCAWFTNNGVAF
jgi:hypothetical protein